MQSVRVSMCCLSPSGHPRFTAGVGDKILARTDEGFLQELTIRALNAELVSCTDVHGESIDISPEQIETLYVS
jgi:hypothetical protein